MSTQSFKEFTEATEKPAPAPAPTEAELTPDSAEIALDPRLEKEIFIDSFEINGSKVIIKSLGLGATKPVVVYIDDKRWEVFPGPKIAKREARRHIKKGKGIKKESIDAEFESFLSEAVLTKSEVQKWIKKNKRKYNDSTEAAFAVATEFGMEDELENEKHWMWPLLKKLYKESYEEPFFNMLESKSFSLQDGTRININEDVCDKVKLVYEYLDNNNKNRFRDAFCINKENYNKVITFVKEQTKGI